MSQSHNVTFTDKGLLLEGLDDASKTVSWSAKVVSSTSILLQASSSATGDLPSQIGFSRLPKDTLYDLLIGVHRRAWTGKILIKIGDVKKNLFFKDGEFVFASSDLIDDRLGEVIYRDDMISLDQLTSFAVKVDRKNKFGQVLLRSGAFSNIDLWRALKAQTHEILRSVFLLDECYLEVHPLNPPMILSFEEKTEQLIDSARLYGENFRSFKSRLRPNSIVSVKSNRTLSQGAQGTFFNDILERCKDRPTWSVFFSRSKLSETTTISTVMKMLAAGHIQVDGLAPAQLTMLESLSGSLSSKLQTYTRVLRVSKECFSSSKVDFPAKELALFAYSLNSDGGSALFLDEQGDVTQDSTTNIYQQCLVDKSRYDFFGRRIEALSRFLLQVSGDLLPQEKVQLIRKEATQ